ncbi:unnamed protein product, partial [Symbiodinium sp. KB8]
MGPPDPEHTAKGLSRPTAAYTPEKTLEIFRKEEPALLLEIVGPGARVTCVKVRPSEVMEEHVISATQPMSPPGPAVITQSVKSQAWECALPDKLILLAAASVTELSQAVFGERFIWRCLQANADVYQHLPEMGNTVGIEEEFDGPPFRARCDGQWWWRTSGRWYLYARKGEVVVAKSIVTFTPDYPNQSGSVLQAEWPHFVFTCHFTWEAGCVVAFRYLSGALLGVGRWKDPASGTKIARMPVCHARTTASLPQELDNVCGGDLKLEAESILRRRELAPDSCFNITLLHNCTIITDNVRLSGPEVFLNRPEAVRATHKMSFTEWLYRCQLAELQRQNMTRTEFQRAGRRDGNGKPRNSRDSIAELVQRFCDLPGCTKTKLKHHLGGDGPLSQSDQLALANHPLRMEARELADHIARRILEEFTMEDTWVHRRVLLFEVPLLPPDIANQLQFAMSKQARQPQVPGNQVHAAVTCQMEAGAAPRAADVPRPWRLIAPRPRRHADIPFPPGAAQSASSPPFPLPPRDKGWTSGRNTTTTTSEFAAVIPASASTEHSKAPTIPMRRKKMVRDTGGYPSKG